MTAAADTGAVVIGRNEGERLLRCLASLKGRVGAIVYVDSGSTDGSLAAAKRVGAEVVPLDLSRPFTAARARNEGLARLKEIASETRFVQFVDGDCEVQSGWVTTARAFLQDHPDIVAVCGRRRERFPEASVYNRLTDVEWDTPVGETRSCGGDALMRVAPLEAVGGFDPTLIAGEEPELCVRLRAAGGRIYRLDHEMTLHDAAMNRLGQWWQRNRRAGYAFAEGAALHGRAPERHRIRETRRAVLWGLALPLVTFLGALITPWTLLLLMAWPLQILRLRIKGTNWTRATFLTLGRLPEGQGVLDYVWRRLRGRGRRLIEYK